MPGSAVHALQVLNALAGALCVALVFLTARRLTARRGLALAVAAGFALSYGTWALSTQAEFVTPPLAVQLLVLQCLIAAPAGALGRRATAAGLGLAVAAATLLYQTSVFLLPVGVACWLACAELPRRRRLVGASLFGAVGLAAATAAYLAVLCAHFGVCDGTSLGSWQLRAGMGTHYGIVTPASLPHGAYALARTLGGYTGIGINDSTADHLAAAGWWRRGAFGAYYAALALVMAWPLAAGWRRRARLWAGWRRAGVGLGVWAALFGAFAVYWVPGDVSFWLPVLAAWWLAVGLVVATGGRR